nr:MAG TPA: hypothetical protein [Caudoviricetes sp.]
MRRRGLLFRQTDAGSWAVLCDTAGSGPDTGTDVLELNLAITDPQFVLYTLWENFRPTAAYSLALPLPEGGTADGTKAMTKSAAARQIGHGLCTVSLRLTEEMWQDALTGHPQNCTLVFTPKACRWEYRLDFRKNTIQPSGQFMLEERNGRLTFPPFVRTESGTLRTVSEESLPMHVRYDIDLKLTCRQENSDRRQTLMRHIPPPEAGAYLDSDPGILRRIIRI